MTLFHWSRSNQLDWTRVVADDDYGVTVGYWLSGRVLGRYVSVFVPWRDKHGKNRPDKVVRVSSRKR